jgi:signal transduction histidine kinase
MGGLWRRVKSLPLGAFARRTGSELWYGLLSLFTALYCWFLEIGMLYVSGVLIISVAGAVLGFPLLGLTLGVARRNGTLNRRLMAWLLGRRVEGPAPFVPGKGLIGRVRKRFKDRPGWRALGYTQVKLLIAVFQGYAIPLVGFGFFNVLYIVWWPLFGGPTRAVFPFTAFEVHSLGRAFTAFGVGLTSLAGGIGLAYLMNWADERAMVRLLGPRTLAERVSELEQTRTLAVEGADAVLRRVERDLHDGAQMRLAALALNLGMARDKLGADEPVVRDLIDAAQRNATDALAELRDLARGIHPPVLDNGLPDALRSLAASSAIPASVRCDLPGRPAPAIETIAWFCASEIMANATKHSYADHIDISLAAQRPDRVRLRITDDGVGGAKSGPGTGLAGLAQRVSTVDGTIDVDSPDGGPTVITVDLPMRA